MQVSFGMKHPNIVLPLVVLALTLLGLVMVYSAGSIEAINEGGTAADYVFKQAMWAVIGIIAAVALWRFIPLWTWRSGPCLWAVFILGDVLLLLTLFMGEEDLGAQRWLRFGGFGIQPSEFAKVTFILAAASTYADFREGRVALRRILVQAVSILVSLLFILKAQSDLGTTIIIGVGLLAVLWLGELDWKVFGIGLVIAALFVVAVIVFGAGYRSDRMVYLDPWNDGEGGYGTGYQIIHSWYALSEGGIFGVGLGNSHEKYLYLPEAETDFIFAILGEELGMLGALAVIIAFLVILYASLLIARSASSPFGTMVAGGLGIMIVFQAFLNIGFVIGVFPTTGKPLPFISSGGSSLVATYIMVGLILAVSQDASSPSIYERRRADLRVVRVADAADSPSASASISTPAFGGGRRSSRFDGEASMRRSGSAGRGPAVSGSSRRTSRR